MANQNISTDIENPLQKLDKIINNTNNTESLDKTSISNTVQEKSKIIQPILKSEITEVLEISEIPEIPEILDTQKINTQEQDTEKLKKEYRTPEYHRNDNNNENDIFHVELKKMAEQTIFPLLHSSCFISIEAIIGNCVVDLMIDTGSTINTLSYNIVKKIGIESYIDKTDTRLIRGVGESVSIGEIHYMEINIDNNTYVSNFTIMDYGSCVIGLPFMLHYGTSFDFGKSKMILGGQKIKMEMRSYF